MKVLVTPHTKLHFSPATPTSAAVVEWLSALSIEDVPPTQIAIYLEGSQLVNADLAPISSLFARNLLLRDSFLVVVIEGIRLSNGSCHCHLSSSTILLMPDHVRTVVCPGPIALCHPVLLGLCLCSLG